MTIEVTQQTFNSIFNDKDLASTEKKETYEKISYLNQGQNGYKVFNYVSSTMYQYYLIDINA